MVSPETVTLSLPPAAFGVASPVTAVAWLKLVSLIVAVEYLRSYDVGVPAFPSSPGDVQVTVIEVTPAADAARLVTADGADVSGEMVVRVAMFDNKDTFGTSSEVLMAK